MRSTKIVVILASVSFFILVDPKLGAGGTLAKLKPNSIDISYGEPKSPQLVPVFDLFRKRRVLEKISDLLAPLRLPHRLLLQTRNCEGIANAWSDEESVTVCYELLDEIWKTVPEKTTPAGIAPVDALLGSSVDVFLHEAGHAVFRLLHVPIFGREEDAADQFSAYVMLRFEKEEARRLILGSAYQYRTALLAPTVTLKQRYFADEHGTSAQRFFNLLCIAYGADPQLFEDIVKKDYLPDERAAGCKSEYEQISFAFDTLIRPYIDKRLARRLHKRWLPSAQ